MPECHDFFFHYRWLVAAKNSLNFREMLNIQSLMSFAELGFQPGLHKIIVYIKLDKR